MEIGNNQYSAEVIIGFTGGNNMLLYDLINLKSTSFTIKKTDASTAQQKTNSEDSRLNASATNMISQNSKDVNERFSKAADTARKNITEQAEVQNDEKIKYGFAGEYAKNADLSLLDRAKLMDENNSEWLVNDDGKNNINDLIKEAVVLETTGKIGFYYLDKKRTQNIFKKSGYQLPSQLKNSGSDIIIRTIDDNVNKKSIILLKANNLSDSFGIGKIALQKQVKRQTATANLTDLLL